MAAVFSVGKHGVAAAVLGVLFLAVVAMHQPVVAGAVAAAVHHHVVGGDPGWDVASDVIAWSANKLFTVGDTLCKSTRTRITYSPASLGSPIFQSPIAFLHAL